LEPQRTNLVTYSSEFDNAAWTKGSGVSVTANTTIAPTGTLTADTLIGASGIDWTLSVLKRQLPPVLSSTTYTLSIYVKSLGSTTFQTSIRNNNTGSQVTVSHSINSDTWTRVEQTYTTTPTQTLVGVIFGGTDGDVAIWGAQFEAESYPTSYIPTTTTAVTRTQDNASKTGISSLIGQTQGSIYAEFVAVKNSAFSDIASLGTNATTLVELQFNGGTNILSGVYFAGTSQASIPSISPLTIGQTYKVAFAYKDNDFVMYLDGVQQGTDTSGTVVAGMSEISLNGFGSSVNNAENALIKAVAVYPTRLSNAELASLTSL
jgi:hypothetical protein